MTTTLRPLVEYIDHNRSNWVASDDDMKTFWRAAYLGDRRFALDGPPVSKRAFGQAGVFSFNAFKVITAGDGGVVVTNSPELYDSAFSMHDQGYHPFEGAKRPAESR